MGFEIDSSLINQFNVVNKDDDVDILCQHILLISCMLKHTFMRKHQYYFIDKIRKVNTQFS